MDPKYTIALLDQIHRHYSAKARDLMRLYAAGDKSQKPALDQAEAADVIVFIFACVAWKQLRK